MGNVIHTRKKQKCLDRTEDTTFRVWSTITDSYVTEELREKELRETVLSMMLEQTVATYFREIGERIELATRNGTSARHETRQTLDWDTERE